MTASVTMAAKSVESETPARIKRFPSMPLPRRASAATSSAAANPADETDQRHCAGRDAREHRDCDRGGRRRADAGEIRIDERIAQHALQQRTAERERRADGRGDADARKAQLPHDRFHDARAMRVRERIRDLRKRQRGAADEHTRRARSDGGEQQAEGHAQAHRLRISTVTERPGIG